MSIHDLISMKSDLPPRAVALVLPVDHPLWARGFGLPEIAALPTPNSHAVARLLLIRGLEILSRGEALPAMCRGRAATINCAGWVDAWCYELASERRVSMRALAQGAVILALEALEV